MRVLGLGFSVTTSMRDEGIEVVELTPDIDDVFAMFLAENGSRFVEWLWSALRDTNVLYGFIPVGGDIKYGPIALDRLAFETLDEFLQTGTFRVVHPLMMFASRLAGSRPCARARAVRWALRECRDGVGCLVGLTSPSAGGFDLLEPGSMYPTVLQEFQ